MDGAVIGYPQDAIVQQGDAVEFSCETTDTKPFTWHFTSKSGIECHIVTGGRVSDIFKDRFIMTSRDNVYVLRIINTSLADCGSYTCVDMLGLGDSASAELIVLSEYVYESQVNV